MDPDQTTIERIMQRYGLEEKEARAYYHLSKANTLLFEIFKEPSQRKLSAGFALNLHLGSLRDMLARRVLDRERPEAWGRMPDRDEPEEPPQ